MKIGIDARPLQAETRHRGIGKSLEFFLMEARELLKNDAVVFYIDKHHERPNILNYFPDAKVIFINSPPILQKKYIRSVFIPWRSIEVDPEDIDALLQYDVSMGVSKNVPTILIFHDLIPYIFREEEKRAAKVHSFKRSLKNQLAGTAYWKQYLRLLKRYAHASTVIPISESSKKDYVTHFRPSKKQRIVVIPHGVDGSFFSKTTLPLSRSLSKQVTKPYFLYIGGIDYRKNITTLLNDFIEVKELHDIQLVLVGKEFLFQDQLNDLGWSTIKKNFKKQSNDIIMPGFISHNDLLTLLRNAKALVFPSLYEGFGMPPLEAMAAGCPVIIYDNSSLPEVVGSYGKIVASGESFSDAMIDVLENPAKYTKVAAMARKRARSFSWEVSAGSIIDELRRYQPTKE